MTPPENDLRDAVARFLKEANPSWFDVTCLELADAMLAGPLAKARADLERVTAERDAADRKMRAFAEGYLVVVETAENEERRALTSEAEVTRLRTLLVDAGGALERIADECDPADPEWSNPASGRANCFQVASRALAALDKAPTPKEPA